MKRRVALSFGTVLNTKAAQARGLNQKPPIGRHHKNCKATDGQRLLRIDPLLT